MRTNALKIIKIDACMPNFCIKGLGVDVIAITSPSERQEVANMPPKAKKSEYLYAETFNNTILRSQ